jgi:hypothetical protein
LELCSQELLKAKDLFDDVVAGKKGDLFDPENGCKELCQLPLRYCLPCRHWMLYFYRKNEPIPINLFHPRWLIDGPDVLHEPWQIRIDNHDYSTGAPLPEERYTGDRSGGAGAQLILDTALAIVERHKNLPSGEKESFALAFKKMCDSLATQHDEKLERLQKLPRRLPDPLVQPKVTFVPGRKRALTGREAADLQEKEEARRRRRAQTEGEKQARNDARQEQYTAEALQRQNEIAEEYSQRIETQEYITQSLPPYVPSSQPQQPHEVISISTDDDLEPSENEEQAEVDEASSDTNDFLDIDDILSQQKPPLLVSLAPSSSRPRRDRKPTAKQVSQDRREIEKREKRKADLEKKPKTVATSQFDDFELPVRSSQ